MSTRILRALGAVCALACFATALCAQKLTLASPQGLVRATITADPLELAATYRGAPALLSSPLGLEFKDQPAFAALKVLATERSAADTTVKLIWGKQNPVRNHFTALIVHLQEVAAPSRRLDLLLRAYDDGIAYRYVVPQQTGITSFVVTRELSGFRFPGDPDVWAATYKNYRSAYEEEYPMRKLSALAPDALIGLPLLAHPAEHVWAAVLEADLTDWAGMYLRHQGDLLAADLSPRLDGNGLVKADAPHASPWRVVSLARTAAGLIESNLLEALSPPSRIADTSWIHPGMMAWDHWWSGDVEMTTAQNLRFIDFAASMGWPYQLIDWQWYGPYNKPTANIMQPAPQLDMPAILAHAKARGVREWLWLHSGDVDRALAAGTLDAAFALYEQWGIAGVKIDFMNSDDQDRVVWYSTIVELAAKHHLMVDFHGAFKPTGMSVTWPNLLTREGVLGNEYNKFSRRVTPLHKATLPFTRGLAGPMDFTPGGFLNRAPANFRVGLPTQVAGSRAAELALFIVYWSPVLCASDDPDHYRGAAGIEFLRNLPTVWDETRALAGAPGENVMIARRAGRDWFLAGITADAAYTREVSLAFLGRGRFRAEIFADPAETTASYEELRIESKVVTAHSMLAVHMRPAGGIAVRFTPLAK